MKQVETHLAIVKVLMLALLAIVAFWSTTRWLVNSETVTVRVELTSQHDFLLQCFFDSGVGFSEGQSVVRSVVGRAEPQTIQVQIPADDIKSIRIDFGDQPGAINVSKVELAEPWLRRPIRDLFTISNQVTIERNQDWTLTPTGNDPFLVSGPIEKDIQEFVADREMVMRWGPRFVGFGVFFLSLLFGWTWVRSKNPIPFNQVFAGGFLIVLYVPFLNGALELKLDDTSTVENRVLEPRPTFSWSTITQYPKSFEKYFNDHFSFRPTWVKLNTFFATRVLATSFPRVSIGDDGWFFYGDRNDGDSNSDHQQLLVLDESTLIRIKDRLEQKQRFFDSLGIKFIITIPPDKQSIYPEFLPASINVRGTHGKRLDQIIDFLRSKQSTVEILDLRGEMLAHKNDSIPIFMKTDTHWNDYGAYLAYRKLTERLGVQPIGLETFTMNRTSKKPGDLVDLIAAGEWYPEPNRVEFLPKSPPPFVEQQIDLYPGKQYYSKPIVVTNAGGPDLPKLLMFRDSFGTPFLKFLPYHFSESKCIWICELDREIVERERPNVVIMEILERYVMCLERE